MRLLPICSFATGQASSQECRQKAMGKHESKRLCMHSSKVST